MGTIRGIHGEHDLAGGTPDTEWSDPVAHPVHYTSHPSGIECIEVVEHFGFCVGNAVKYLWRAGLKPGADELEDLRKAAWYVAREIERREQLAESLRVAVEQPTPPEYAEPSVADRPWTFTATASIDLVDSVFDRCAAVQPRSEGPGYLCTRPTGHAGDHVAQGVPTGDGTTTTSQQWRRS